MRLVIDTNIVVSALLKAGSVPAIVLRLATQSHVIIKSIETEHEARATVQRPKLSSLIAPDAIHWLDTILASAETVTIAERYQSCRDTKDNKFLDLAVSGRADLIITGDADLLVLGAFRDIPIIAPVTFLRAYYPGRLA
jgi:uncharacterized protein